MDEILSWHRTPWQHLAQQVQAGRLPHALLFSGPQGIGKQHIAQLWVAKQCCQQAVNSVEDNVCGVCCGCQLLANESHPDIITIIPEEGAAIKIAQVQVLLAQVDKAPLYAAQRYVVISPAEALNPSAANALLKLIESPPSATVFLLISHAVHRLLPTIRSRCQLIKFLPPASALALPWLLAQCPAVAPELVEKWLQLFAGAALRVQQLLQQGAGQLYDQLLAGRGASLPTTIVEQCLGYELELCLDLLALLLIEQVKAQAVQGKIDLAYAQLLDAVYQSKASVQQHIVLNKRLQLESLLGRWCRLK